MKAWTKGGHWMYRRPFSRRPAALLAGVVAILTTATPMAFADPALVAQPMQITAANRSEFTGILPTWRRVTPVGTVVSTPNFPT
ncbi:hypothetical protein HAP98_00725, partial [Acidithiobacillus caldus]